MGSFLNEVRPSLGDAFLLAVWRGGSYNLRSGFHFPSRSAFVPLRWRTDAKDMNMKMSVIQIVSLV